MIKGGWAERFWTVIVSKDDAMRRATEAQVSLATIPSGGQAKSTATAVSQYTLRECRLELDWLNQSSFRTRAKRRSAKARGRQ